MPNNSNIIVDPMGQWKYPGIPTRIPSSNITMMGVDYPVVAKPNKGKQKLMKPGLDYKFPGAQYVDEYPMVNMKIPSLGKEKQGLYVYPNLDLADNMPHFGVTVGYKTPRVNISGNYMYGSPTLTAAYNFENGGQHGGLDRWFAEKWVDIKTGKTCGRQEGEKRRSYPACRPSRRVSEDTPKTSGELSPAEREKFKRSKTSSERINYQHRRKEYGGETNDSDMANKPNNPSLWSKAKSLAKQKFDVYPSAYANGWAAKWYKGHGGTWRKAEEGMEVPYMAEGGKPDWLVEAQLKAQGYSGDALEQKMSSMANGGEPQNAGFQALPEYVQDKIMGAAYGGYIPEMAAGGWAQQAAIAIAMKKAGKKPKQMKEGGDPDGEMALGQIDAAIMKLQQLRKFIQPDSDLEPWVNSKLTLIDDYATSASDYMMHNPEEQGGEMEEMKNGGIPQRYKNMGFTHVGQKKQGDGKHKWKVLAKKGDQYKVVQGGWRGMEDFKQHHNEKRRERFWDRMGGRNSSKATDPFSPLYWHKRFGTWEEGGELYEMQDGGVSIVDYLSQRGMAYDKASRKKLAEQMGVKDYDFSADKNLELLSLMRNQEVKDPVKKPVQAKRPVSNSGALPSMMMPFGPVAYTPSEKNPNYPIMSYPAAEKRNLESGTIVDKGTNTMYIIQNNKVVKKAPVLTGQAGKNKSKDPDKNVKGVAYLENNPQDRSTPTGTYFMQEPGKAGIYGWPGFGLKPIPAFGEAAPEAKATAIHITYGSKPKPGSGMKGHPDPAEYKRRNAAYSGPASGRYMSYGCTNAQGETIDCLNNMFPKGDTAIYIDSRDPIDKRYINSVMQRREEGGSTFSGNAWYEMGGMPCYECGGMYAYGGIHLDPAKKGTFKAQATKMGMSTQEAAAHILANKEDYSPDMVKKANFAKNFAKKEGGPVVGQELDVNEKELNDLIAQGYKVKIINP